MNGYPTPLPETPAKPAKHDPLAPAYVDWSAAYAWDTALARAGAPKPSSIPGMQDTASLYWLAQEICQWWFLQERLMKKFGDEKVEKMKGKSAKRMSRFLEKYGY